MARLPLTLVLSGAAAATVIWQYHIRLFEAAATSKLLSGVFGMTAPHNPVQPTVYFTLPGHPPSGLPAALPATSWSGMTVTPECTAAFLIAPLFVVAAVLAVGRRISVRALLVATVATTVVLLVVNLVRLLVIATAAHRWGLHAFDLAHDVYGSLITVAGVCLGIAVFAKLLIVLTRRHNPSLGG